MRCRPQRWTARGRSAARRWIASATRPTSSQRGRRDEPARDRPRPRCRPERHRVPRARQGEADHRAGARGDRPRRPARVGRRRRRPRRQCLCLRPQGRPRAPPRPLGPTHRRGAWPRGAPWTGDHRRRAPDRRDEGLALNGAFLYAAARRVDGLALVQGAIVRYPVLPDGRLGAPGYFLASGFEDRPKGLALDRLGALYVSSKEIRIGGAQATRALGKVHPNAHLTEFTRELDDPQGLALGADGSLYVADGDGGRLIRFRAPPAPTLTGLSEFIQHSPLTVTGTTEAQARVDLFLNDAATAFTIVATGTGTVTLPVPLALDAANTLEVFATARGGIGLTSAAVEVTVKHDDVAPNLLFLPPPALAHVRQSVVIQAEATDGGSGIAALTVSAGSQPLTAPLAPTPPAPTVRARAPWDTTTVADGAVGLRATATDRVGNTATLTRSVIVDNAPPVITLTDGPAEGAVTSASVTFAFAVSDNLTAAPDLGVTLRLGGVPVAGAASPVTLTGLLTGPHIFSITARDRAGNEATVTRGFTVSVGPAISTVEPASGPIGTLVTITGTSFEPGATVTFNGLAAVIRTLSATTITTTVPVGATTGPLVVTTSRGTASRTFTVGTTGDFTLTAAPGTARAVAGDQTSVTLAAGGR